MDNLHYISSEVLSIETIQEIITQDKKLALSNEAKENILKCRSYLDSKMESHEAPIYGINTGFGSLCNVIISNDNLSKLQENLVKSHACGIGDEVPHEIVKIMLLIKIQSLSYGNSGVQLITVQRLVDFYNNYILPVIYNQGSLGASGDLAPLAHLSLPLLGEGEVYFDGFRQPAKTVLEKFGWEPIVLQSKEGLALLNGTQFMSSYGCYILLKAMKYSYFADVIAAISLEGFDGRIEPFNELIHYVRPHKGQISTAKRMSELLEGSQIIAQPKQHVQDPYSFRCIPQVHGASKDTIDYVKKVFKTEINSVTDNGTYFTFGVTFYGGNDLDFSSWSYPDQFTFSYVFNGSGGGGGAITVKYPDSSTVINTTVDTMVFTGGGVTVTNLGATEVEINIPTAGTFGAIVASIRSLSTSTSLSPFTVGALTIPYNGEITGWTIFSDVACTATVDFLSDPFATYPPTTNLLGANTPNLSAENKNDLTGISIPVIQGQTLLCNLTSISGTVARIDVTLLITKS